MIRLYNTLTRRTEPLQPVHPGEVRMYSCGPTVYWFAHIGNLRSFVFADLLARLFRARGLKVTAVMNITDVGHLTSDADEGEDKMIAAMRREGKSAWDVAAFYADAFFRDLKRINVEPADAYPRATAHIAEQIGLVERLEKNGFTYRTEDGIYFDTSKLADYGRLSRQKAAEKKAGARVEMGGKKQSTDFALWKFSPTGGKRDMEWESPWGVGFPGWHLECSAMSAKYLGVPFDVHTGGVDHIAVHHEDELAQTEAATGALEANVWMHNEFITIDGGKMSKSLGNVYTLDDLAAKGFDPLALRYYFLGAHYRSKLNFTFEALEAAQNALKRLRAFVRSVGESDCPTAKGGSLLAASRQAGGKRPRRGGGSIGEVEPAYERAFDAALDDDLDTPEGLAILWEMLEDKDITPADRLATLLHFDRMLGLRLADEVGKKDEIPAEVQALLDERAAARAAKDWTKADALRDRITAHGFTVEDTAKGQIVRAA